MVHRSLPTQSGLTALGKWGHLHSLQPLLSHKRRDLIVNPQKQKAKVQQRVILYLQKWNITNVVFTTSSSPVTKHLSQTDICVALSRCDEASHFTNIMPKFWIWASKKHFCDEYRKMLSHKTPKKQQTHFKQNQLVKIVKALLTHTWYYYTGAAVRDKDQR